MHANQGMEEYLNKGRDMGEKPSERIEKTLLVLESMTDYKLFKQTMLIKKAAAEDPAPPVRIVGKDIKDFIDFEVAVDAIAEIRRAEGEWKHAGDMSFPGKGGHVLQLETRPVPNSKKTACRFSYQINLPYEQFKVAMSADQPDRVWKVGEIMPEQNLSDVVKEMSIVKILDNGDIVFRLQMELPWLARWMTGIPSEIYILNRVVHKPDEVCFFSLPPPPPLPTFSIRSFPIALFMWPAAFRVCVHTIHAFACAERWKLDEGGGEQAWKGRKRYFNLHHLRERRGP